MSWPAPTRCFQNENDGTNVCIWLDTLGGGSPVCMRATYNDQVCQRCTAVDESPCTTTTEQAYAIDCTNLGDNRELTACGSTLFFQSGSDSDDEWPSLGLLIPLALIVVAAIGFLVYLLLRRGQETPENDEEKALPTTTPSKKTKQNAQEQPIDKKSKKPLARKKPSSMAGSKKKAAESSSGNNNNRKRPKKPPPDKKPSTTRSVTSTKSDRSLKSNKSNRSGKSSEKGGKSGVNGSATGLQGEKTRAISPGRPKDPRKDGENKFEKIVSDPDRILPTISLEPYSEVKNDPDAMALYKHHVAGNWQAIRDFFESIRRRIIERQHYSRLMVQWISSEWPTPVNKDKMFCNYLDEWNRAEPENLQCNVIRLEVWIAWAWHGRTTAFAHEISPQRVALFYDRMDKGAAELERVLRITKKKDALVYAAAIKIATGRNDEQHVVQQYMQAVQQSNDPANYVFHTRAMEYFSEKWHGSNKEMMDYATWITGQLPDGHPLWILIPVAHYECALLINSTSERRKHWSQHHDDIVAAYERALGGPWEIAINEEITPACMKLDAVVRNWFLYALGKCNAKELARRQARVIGKRPLPDLPWNETYTYAKHVKMLGFDIEDDLV